MKTILTKTQIYIKFTLLLYVTEAEKKTIKHDNICVEDMSVNERKRA